MFQASEPFRLFDELRIPYALGRKDVAHDVGDPGRGPGALAEVRSLEGARAALRWPVGGRGPISEYRLGDIPFFAEVATDGALDAAAAADDCERVGVITDQKGTRAASIWRQPDGSIVLPFDPNQAMLSYLKESYQDVEGASELSLRRFAVGAYYRARPLMPRRLQLALRQQYARVQRRRRFPRWPYEPARHDLVRVIYGFVSEVRGAPPPWIAPWPKPYSWSLVLTHDVETEDGYRNLARVRAVEEAAGFRSSWNFVPRRYAVADDVVSDLQDAGFEVGVHGLHHDGRDLESSRMLGERLPEIRRWAERWRAVGFRSPATQRRWEWMDDLGFDYDSSYTDTAPFEPQAGGCCSWLPFFIGDTVELPITIEQDHTVFVILKQRDASIWLDKARRLRDRGGMALMITHPDYLVDQALLQQYGRFLDDFRSDERAWRALPRDVSAWWRRRAASTLVRDDQDGWTIDGPAADDAVVTTEPPG